MYHKSGRKDIKMKMNFRLLALAICAAISISGICSWNFENVKAEDRELRGIWVATVANIDFPKTQTKDPETLKKELVTIFENCANMGYNAVFLQVRPCSDALYKSEIFPWSKYLTGEQGAAPDDGFDPLEFAVGEAHKRGLELHAWINPYRITKSPNDFLTDDNPAVKYPEIVLKDASGNLFYNPGNSRAIDLIVDGAVEIVKNYDVDGLHMDDYFYPSGAFDDSETYAPYAEEYPDLGNWRRENVNKLVKSLDEKLHEARPDIEFGISPRGVWANKSDVPDGSDTKGGGSYTTIFADSKAWVKNGWVDYIMPQIYWNIGYEIADYKILSDWWSDVVKGTDVKLYIGEAAYRTINPTSAAWTGEAGTNELKTHILMGRDNPDVAGYCCYTYNSFIKNFSIYALMQELNFGKAEAYPNKFSDTDGFLWAKSAVNYLDINGIMDGKAETEFDPGADVTRADNTVALFRVLEKTAEFSENFSDVTPDKYYYNEIGMAKALGIASGIGDNLFDPEAPIKRQDMMTIAYRVLLENGLTAEETDMTVLDGFKDADDVSDYAKDAVAFFVKNGIISGDGDKALNPDAYAKRAEAAVFTCKIAQLVKASGLVTGK